MIKDEFDFNYVNEQLLAEIKPDITLQDKTLNSEAINTSFKNIEDNLNTLYEKCRYMEDLNNYCKSLLSMKIKEFKGDFKTTLDLIENVRDINKNMNYMQYEVPLNNSNFNTKDRNFSKIYPAVLQNNKLILANIFEDTIDYKSCERSCKQIPYSENLYNIKQEPYRTTYIERNIIKGGITERITINFDMPIRINTFDLGVSNAEVCNIVYKYINGTEEYQEKYVTSFVKERSVMAISFELKCKNYNHSIYKIDKNKMTEDTWDKIKEYEYNFINDYENQSDLTEFIEVIRDQSSTPINKQEETANIVAVDNYTYSFGLDYITIKFVEPHMKSCYVSKEVNIGTLGKDDYITIDTNHYQPEGTTIEYSILDGDREIPILPEKLLKIDNEKIFHATDLRFAMGDSDYYTIRESGHVVDIDLEEAKHLAVDNYSVDYTPDYDLCYNLKPINKSIRVKAVLRRYNERFDMPYISNVKIKKFGGIAPWIENL